MRLLGLFSILALIALFLETAIPHLIPAHVLIPNLIVILAVDLGLRYHGTLGALMAFAMGYATDAFSGIHLGVNAFLMTLVYLLTYEMSRRLLVTNALVGSVFVFFGVMLTSLGGLWLGSGTEVLSESGPMLPWLLAQAAITAIIAPFVFALVAQCRRAIGLPARAARE